jgi:hypothetical protein
VFAHLRPLCSITVIQSTTRSSLVNSHHLCNVNQLAQWHPHCVLLPPCTAGPALKQRRQSLLVKPLIAANVNALERVTLVKDVLTPHLRILAYRKPPWTSPHQWGHSKYPPRKRNMVNAVGVHLPLRCHWHLSPQSPATF